MSSWETVVVKVRREARPNSPRRSKSRACLRSIPRPTISDALVASAQPYLAKPHDHLLFSYHSIPQRHLTKADSSARALPHGPGLLQHVLAGARDVFIAPRFSAPPSFSPTRRPCR